jgi:hypothetical protein
VTLDEIKQLIKTGQVASEAPILEEGLLNHSLGHSTPYSIQHGWNIVSSVECDEVWGSANLELYEYIDQQDFDDDELNRVLDSIQVEDHHWDWFKKSIGCTGDEYEWFYLYADNKPQAACLIYHPKVSAFGNSNIFYVKFLAVAPWNRSCLIREREYLGVGTTLLKTALSFSVNQLGLSPGFSLHSLPQASGYYEKINMINVEGRDEDGLLYFELPNNEANKLLEVV